MKKIIIDCDPGHDDAVALFLATRLRELDILGVSVVAGNSSLRNTLQNARDILAFADASDIPVYAGCERPLKRDLMNQSGRKIHGDVYKRQLYNRVVIIESARYAGYDLRPLVLSKRGCHFRRTKNARDS